MRKRTRDCSPAQKRGRLQARSVLGMCVDGLGAQSPVAFPDALAIGIGHALKSQNCSTDFFQGDHSSCFFYIKPYQYSISQNQTRYREQCTHHHRGTGKINWCSG